MIFFCKLVGVSNKFWCKEYLTLTKGLIYDLPPELILKYLVST